MSSIGQLNMYGILANRENCLKPHYELTVFKDKKKQNTAVHPSTSRENLSLRFATKRASNQPAQL